MQHIKTITLLLFACSLFGASLTERRVDKAVENFIKAREELAAELDKAEERATKDGDQALLLSIRKERDRLLSGAAIEEEVPAPADNPYAQPQEVEIEAASAGVSLGKLRPGDKIVMQYMSGSWKAYGTWDMQSPDDAGVIAQHRLAVQYSDNEGKPMRDDVPCNTARRGHIYVVTGEGEHFLRIADPVLDANEGSVIYKVQVLRGQ